jgi:hypothetical protein
VTVPRKLGDVLIGASVYSEWLVPEYDRDCETIGTCDQEERQIVVVDGPAERVAKTRLHERLHGISNELGLGWTEQDVCKLEVALWNAGVRVI